MKKIIICALLVIAPVLASAGEITSSQIISHMQYYQGHDGLLIRQPQMKRLEECSRADYYMLPKNHPYYQEITALILAAHFSSHKLKMYIV